MENFPLIPLSLNLEANTSFGFILTFHKLPPYCFVTVKVVGASF